MNTGGASEAKRTSDTEENLRILIADAEKMGLTPDIRDILDGLDDYKHRLEAKVQELSIIEAIAMESKDENVRELREQLFMAVKLIHSDEIIEVENEYNKRETMPSSGLTFSTNVRSSLIGNSMTIDDSNNDKISKYDVMERIRRHLNRRAEYKQFIKQQ